MALACDLDGGTEAGASGADDHRVVAVVMDFHNATFPRVAGWHRIDGAGRGWRRLYTSLTVAETKTMTRAESQERTRQALLAAAAARFSEQGYLGTTLAQVAADAGLTKGAVYANFTSKADLFLEVRKAWTFSGLPEVAERLEGVTDIETCMTVVADWIATFADESANRQRANLEYLVEANRSADTAAAFRDPWHETGQLIKGLVVGEFRRLAGLEIDPDDLDDHVDVLVAAIIGLGILRSLDPAVRSDAYRLAVRNFCAAAASLAR